MCPIQARPGRVAAQVLDADAGRSRPVGIARLARDRLAGHAGRDRKHDQHEGRRALHSEAIDTDDSAPGMRPPVGYSSGDAEENREGG